MAVKRAKGLDVYRSTLALLEKHRLDARRGHAALSSLAQKDLDELLGGSFTQKQTKGAFARGEGPWKSLPPAKRLAPATMRRREMSARKMANRDLKGTIPVNPVNAQSGRLRRGVRLRRGNQGAQDYRLVVSGVDYAEYVLAIGGTRFMVSRDIQPELKRRWTPRNKALLDHLRNQRKPS